MAESAAKSPATVLLTGESGVGKDLVARYIHNHSSRSVAPFVGVNCAGLTEARLESELFGHIDGDMTGGWPEKRGKLRLAHRGTLFLDECGDMTPRMQAWLMRFLENGDVQRGRIGGIAGPRRRSRRRRHQSQPGRPRRRRAVPRETFCTGCASFTSTCLPSASRPEDVDALTRHFLARSGRELSFTDDALRALSRYEWPGNVRELQNVVEQLVWLSGRGLVGVEQLPVSIRCAPGLLTGVDPEFGERSKSRPH